MEKFLIKKIIRKIKKKIIFKKNLIYSIIDKSILNKKKSSKYKSKFSRMK